MHDSLNLDDLAAEARARQVLRRRLNIALALCAGLCLLLFFLTSFMEDPSPEVVIAVTFLLIGLAFIYLFVTRSSIGWGLLLYAFRPGREALRHFGPAHYNWRPWLVTAVGVVGFVGVTLGMPLGVLPVTGVLLAGMFAQIRVMSALQRGDYDALLRDTTFAGRWLMFPNVFSYRVIALVNTQRFDEAIRVCQEHMAQAPRLAPCLAEPLYVQALALTTARRYPEMLPPLETALRLVPENGTSYLTLAEWCLTYAENPTRALEILDAGKPFLKVFQHTWYLAHARANARLGRHAEAEHDLSEVEKMNIQVYPQIMAKVNVLSTTVEVKARSGNLDAAHSALQQLEALDPENNLTQSARKLLDEIEHGGGSE